MSVRRLSLLIWPTINAKSGWGCTGRAIDANKEGNCAKVCPHECKPCALALRLGEHIATKNEKAPRKPELDDQSGFRGARWLSIYFAVRTASRVRLSFALCPALPGAKDFVNTKPR